MDLYKRKEIWTRNALNQLIQLIEAIQPSQLYRFLYVFSWRCLIATLILLDKAIGTFGSAAVRGLHNVSHDSSLIKRRPTNNQKGNCMSIGTVASEIWTKTKAFQLLGKAKNQKKNKGFSLTRKSQLDMKTPKYQKSSYVEWFQRGFALILERTFVHTFTQRLL